jgi:hypothetical protein
MSKNAAEDKNVADQSATNSIAAPEANHVEHDLWKRAPTTDRSLRLLTMVDEYTRQSAIRVALRLNSYHVIETLG